MVLEEFELLSDTFKKARISVKAVSLDDKIIDIVDENIKVLFKNSLKNISVNEFIGAIKPKTLYIFKDNMKISLITFLLTENRIVFIGPYLYEPLSKEQILEISENSGISPKNQRIINEYFSSVPVILENSSLFLLLDSFCERIWKKYDTKEIFKGVYQNNTAVFSNDDTKDIDDTLLNMKNMERRYQFENEILDAVMLGRENKIKQIFSTFSENSFEKRITDSLRNAKNYCIIMNTLLRKAAERGGVHPIYLDQISSKYAIDIEKLSSTEKIKDFMAQMFKSYCKLVNKNSTKEYSPFVQKAVIAIESDPSQELSLNSLANKLNVSNVYLSTIFKKETGKTITEYIHEKRMNYAEYLLSSTNLQIQTVALHCGILDVHYFTKLFKKHTGKTPTEFRLEKNI